MTNNSIDRLIEAACDTAMRSAVAYIRQHGIKFNEDSLLSCLRANVKIRWTEALAHAKQAIDANMGSVAEQTFHASMAVAGIEAAKEASII